MIRIGLLGAGAMASLHAAAIHRNPRATLAGICAPDPTAQELAATYAVPAVRDPEELFGRDVDAVIIATPTPTHADLIAQACDAELGILCEKPLVRSEEEIAQIEKLLANYHRVVMVAQTLRFFPEYRYARNLLQEGQLGELGVLRLGRAAGFSRPPDHWLNDFEKSGGATLDLMIHDLDFVEWAAGPLCSLYARRVAATSLANDTCYVVGRLATGALVHLEASWAEQENSFYYYYEIAGRDGILEYDSRREPALSYLPRSACDQPQSVLLGTPVATSPVERQLEAFLDAIEGIAPPAVTWQEGVRAVRLALAALDSAAKNLPVAV